MISKSELIEESGSRVQRRQARTREALIRAARRLIARNGFEGTTVAGIAKAAKVGFGTVYLYFASKDELLEAVLDDSIREIAEALRTLDTSALAPADALLALSERFIVLVRAERDLLMLAWQQRPRPGRRGRTLAEVLTPLFRDVIDGGVAASDFTVRDAEVAARAITGMHIQLLFQREGAQTEEALLGTLPSMALAAVRHAGNPRR